MLQPNPGLSSAINDLQVNLYAHNDGKEFPATGFISISLMKRALDSMKHLNSIYP